jgi:ketosteroid isomerase-like protein
MTIPKRIVLPLLLTCAGVIAASIRLQAQHQATQQDMAGIERLHQLDIQTTLTDKADELAKLWDDNAVRIQPSVPPEVGKAVIYANDKKWEKENKEHTLCYRPEIQDVQIAGDIAYEWGYFSYRASSDPKVSRGKLMRVMKREPDGSWKFVRVMAFEEKSPAGAPLAHPCE